MQRHQTFGRQLAFKAQDHGYTLAGTTLNHIRAGRYKSVPTDDTIKAIALLAGVSEEVAFTAAGQTVPGPPLADELPPGADNLSPKSRKVVLDMVRVLVDLEAGNHGTQDKPEANPPGPRTLRAVGSIGEAVDGQKIGPWISDKKRGSIVEAVLDSLIDEAGSNPDHVGRENAVRTIREAAAQGKLGICQEVSSDAETMKDLTERVLDKVKAWRRHRRLLVECDGSVPLYVSMAGGSGDGNVTKLNPSDPDFETPPSVEQLAAHPNFKTEHEQFEEQRGERGEEDQSNE